MEVDHLLEVHRRERRRAEAAFDLSIGAVACVVLAVLYAFGVI